MQAVTLDDKYLSDQGRIYLTGIQALVRLALVQRRRDLAAEPAEHPVGKLDGQDLVEEIVQAERELLGPHSRADIGAPSFRQTDIFDAAHDVIGVVGDKARRTAIDDRPTLVELLQPDARLGGEPVGKALLPGIDPHEEEGIEWLVRWNGAACLLFLEAQLEFVDIHQPGQQRHAPEGR